MPSADATRAPPGAFRQRERARASRAKPRSENDNRRDRGGRGLGFRLARIGIGVRRHELADARAGGGLVAPVDRHEQRAALLVLADHDLEHAAPAVPSRPARSRRRSSPAASASSGCTSTNGSGRWAASRGLMPVRVIVCHWSRMRPVLRRSGYAADVASRQARQFRRDEPRLAVGREEAAIGEEARVRHALVTGSACRSCADRPLHRLERVVVRVRDRGEAADIEIARAFVLERRERRVLAEHIGRATRRRTRRRSPSACATSATIHQSGLASPGSGRNARWREMRRSELVTVPSFSPQAAAGSSTCAPAFTVSFESTFSDTTKSSSCAAPRAPRRRAAATPPDWSPSPTAP